jgi:hypothetical protein
MSSRPEIIKALTVLAAAYPKFELTNATIEIYVRLLTDLEFDLLKAATLHCASTKTFFPSVAEIRSAAVDLQTMVEGIPCAADAWQNVLSEISRVGSYGHPEFKHPLVSKTVRQLGWRNLCLSENMVADRARFLDIYTTALATHNMEHRMLPEIRAIVDQRALEAHSQLQLLTERLTVNKDREVLA